MQGIGIPNVILCAVFYVVRITLSWSRLQNTSKDLQKQPCVGVAMNNFYESLYENSQENRCKGGLFLVRLQPLALTCNLTEKKDSTSLYENFSKIILDDCFWIYSLLVTFGFPADKLISEAVTQRFCKKSCSEIISKNHRKTPAQETPF